MVVLPDSATRARYAASSTTPGNELLPSRRSLRDPAVEPPTISIKRPASARHATDVPTWDATPSPMMDAPPTSAPERARGHARASIADLVSMAASPYDSDDAATEAMQVVPVAQVPTLACAPSRSRHTIARNNDVQDDNLPADLGTAEAVAPASTTETLPTRRQLRAQQVHSDQDGSTSDSPTFVYPQIPMVAVEASTPSRRQLRTGVTTRSAATSSRLADGAPGERAGKRDEAGRSLQRRRNIQRAASAAATIVILTGAGYAWKTTSEANAADASEGQQAARVALDNAVEQVESANEDIAAQDAAELQRGNEVSRQLQETAIRQSQAVEVASLALSKGQLALDRSRDVLDATTLAGLTDLVNQLQGLMQAGDISGMVQVAEQVSTGAADITQAMTKLDPQLNGRLPDSYLCELPFAPGFRLRCDAAEALILLNEAYKADFGRDLEVNSAYRTYGEQSSLQYSRAGWAQPAGVSRHGWGISVDFNSGTIGGYGSEGDAWFKEHAPDFGWVRPAEFQPGSGSYRKGEYWHWDYMPQGEEAFNKMYYGEGND